MTARGEKSGRATLAGIGAALAVGAAVAAPADGHGIGTSVSRAWEQATDAGAWSDGRSQWQLGLAPLARHFRYSAEHRNVWAVSVERHRDDGWLAGASYFRNSFGQPSAYVFGGRRFPGLFGIEPLFAQASAGVLYGYRGAFKNKVPLNFGGFSPGALVGLGWQLDRDHALTLHLLGDAAVMLQLTLRLH